MDVLSAGVGQAGATPVRLAPLVLGSTLVSLGAAAGAAGGGAGEASCEGVGWVAVEGENACCNLLKGALDVVAGLCACFEDGQVSSSAKVCDGFRVNGPFSVEVVLVCNKEDACVWAAVPLHLFDPLAEVVKGLDVGNVKEDEDALPRPIEQGGAGTPSLQGNIPPRRWT